MTLQHDEVYVVVTHELLAYFNSQNGLGNHCTCYLESTRETDDEGSSK